MSGTIILASVTCACPGAVSGCSLSREVMYKVMIVRNHIEGMERCPTGRRCPRLHLVSMLSPSMYFLNPSPAVERCQLCLYTLISDKDDVPVLN
jgi:hypothetical protein